MHMTCLSTALLVLYEQQSCSCNDLTHSDPQALAIWGLELLHGFQHGLSHQKHTLQGGSNLGLVFVLIMSYDNVVDVGKSAACY